MQKGDIVCLKADVNIEFAMIVEKIEVSCDGTGGDGAGLYCQWFEGHNQVKGWVSESSVKMVESV